MIPVTPAEEPSDFQSKVRERGLRAIAEMVGERPRRKSGRPFGKIASRREEIPAGSFPTYWTECLDDFLNAFNRICAYSCFRIHPVTGAASVDHFAPKSRKWNKVYEWNNYRLAAARLNARKNSFEDLIDPFDVQEAWFHLELVGFQVFPNPQLNKSLRQQIETTITRLGLNDFRHEREDDAQRYWDGEITLKTLQRESPFVAFELARQNRLNPPEAKTAI